MWISFSTYVIIYKKHHPFKGSRHIDMTSVKKRIDHVLNELDSMGTNPETDAPTNVIAELTVIKGAYRETKLAPMCCFRFDADNKILCDVIGPLEKEQFMEKCKQCQSKIKNVLINLYTD
jgi:hypothetical protein